ncbi:kelch like family member 8 [Rhinolophus ferrumequinum]|uniref:Kelch like family member 8 n=1 Tax=Rhinolophus ferrumequinum TaxID=59479 RepID=A0A7J7ZCA6_RHIFE|nr:kelch like family member 8 [Rhinolophus ferrumequinum]
MASESMNAKQARNQCTKGKRQQHQQIKNRSSVSDGDGEDSFIFEAHEAWKDFHESLLRFYENGELCDITLKVCCSVSVVEVDPETLFAVLNAILSTKTVGSLDQK